MRRVRRRPPLACRRLVELVTDYLEGDLDPAVRAAVEEHLAGCGNCSGYVTQVRRMLVLTAGTLDRGVGLPPDLLEELLTRYRQRH